MKQILVTGGSGELGNRLCGVLASTGELHLRVLVRNRPPGGRGLETVRGDLLDRESLRVAVRGMDGVFHLAALTHAVDERSYERVNVEGTDNVIAACKAEGVKRLVHVGSTAAHPRGGGYSLSKWRADERVRQSGLSWLILSPSDVYGPGSKDAIQKLIGWVTRWPLIPVVGDGTSLMSPAFAEDVISAMARAIRDDSLAGQTLVLAGPESMPFNDLVGRLGGFFGRRPGLVHVPAEMAQGLAWLASRIGFPPGIVPDQVPRLLCPKNFDITASRELLGYEPRTLEEGLRLIYPDVQKAR